MEEMGYFIQRDLYMMALVEWLADIFDKHTIEDKEELYQEKIGATYYCYWRWTKPDSTDGIYAYRPDSYQDLCQNFNNTVAKALKELHYNSVKGMNNDWFQTFRIRATANRAANAPTIGLPSVIIIERTGPLYIQTDPVIDTSFTILPYPGWYQNYFEEILYRGNFYK